MDNQLRMRRLPEALLPWYAKNRRDLPWRQDKDPYHVWISEIMLQQTRVEAVKAYYTRFLDVLPTIQALADADDALLQKLWEGLGYYSRVQNLKKAALQIVEQRNGIFPREYDQVLKLPGIGNYTAGAICSIVFNQPTPAVDGNVLRVIARILDDHTPIDLPAFKTSVHKRLQAIYPLQAGDFTQALMELGATVCGPNRKPNCQACPCKDFCLGYQKGNAEALPVKSSKKARRQESRTVFILSCNGRFALEKRPNKGLLAGLWQFPNVEGKLEIAEAIKEVEQFRLIPAEIFRQVEKKHVFTHIEWDMRGIYIEVKSQGGDFTWLTADAIRAHAALPTAFRQFWDEREN